MLTFAHYIRDFVPGDRVRYLYRLEFKNGHQVSHFVSGTVLEQDEKHNTLVRFDEVHSWEESYEIRVWLFSKKTITEKHSTKKEEWVASHYLHPIE